jgi:hypothetical protein
MASKEKGDKLLEKCVQAMNDFRLTMSQRSIEESLKFVSIDELPQGELEQVSPIHFKVTTLIFIN